MAKTMIGVIGGSGLYEIDGLENATWQTDETPWGPPSDAILTGTLAGVPMAFLPRHGRGHVHTPSSVPYRANIDALKRLGVTDVISVSACGSFREDMAPGATIAGPAVIAEDETSTFVSTSFDAHIDGAGSIVMERKAA